MTIAKQSAWADRWRSLYQELVREGTQQREAHLRAL
jgi:hypothetical protein